MAKSLGYRTVFWSLAYVDWNRDAQPTPEQAYEKLLPRIHRGAVYIGSCGTKAGEKVVLVDEGNGEEVVMFSVFLTRSAHTLAKANYFDFCSHWWGLLLKDLFTSRSKLVY